MRTSRDTRRTLAAFAVVFVTLLAAPTAAAVNLHSHASANAVVHRSFDDDHHHAYGDNHPYGDDHRQSGGDGASARGSGSGSTGGAASQSGSGSGVTPVTHTRAS